MITCKYTVITVGIIVCCLGLLQVDLLHPLTILEWEEQRCKIPDNVHLTEAQAAVLGDMVYVGGWDTSAAYGGPGSLLIYDVTRDSWGKCIATPTSHFALTTYGSKLVLVGGMYPHTPVEIFLHGNRNRVTNKLWVLDEQEKFSDCLPAMQAARMRASAISRGSHLVVAGGNDGCSASILTGEVGVVEVYNGHAWAWAQSLPYSDSGMKSILHEGNWYLNGRIQFQTSLDSLIATASSNILDMKTSVWKKVTDLPQHSAHTVFGSQLVDIEHYSSSDSQGTNQSKSALRVFSPQCRRWVHVGDLPVACRSICMLLLPTRELLVVVLEAECRNHPRPIFKGSVTGGNIYLLYIAMYCRILLQVLVFV